MIGILSSGNGIISWADYNRKVPPICSSYCSTLLGQLNDTLTVNLQQRYLVTSISPVDGRLICKRISALGLMFESQRLPYEDVNQPSQSIRSHKCQQKESHARQGGVKSLYMQMFYPILINISTQINVCLPTDAQPS